MNDHDASLRRVVRSVTANLGRWGVFVMDLLAADPIRTIVDEKWPDAAVVNAKDYESWMSLEQHLQEISTQASIIHIIGLDGWMTTGNNRAANIRRESFAHSVPVPVLFWMTPEQIKNFATEAPDLWSWRTGVFSLD